MIPAITISHSIVSSTIPGKGLTSEEKQLVSHAIDAYSFLLPLGDHSWTDLADAIAAYYSLAEPHNKAVHAAVLRCAAAYETMYAEKVSA